MMKIKRFTAILLAAALSCTAPAAVYASEASGDVFMENQIEGLMNDPEKAVDIVMYVKDAISDIDIPDEEIKAVIEKGAGELGITLDDDDAESVLKIVKKVQGMEINEEKLKETVTKVYDKIDQLGIEKEDVKNLFEKFIDFVKGLF